MVVTATRRHGEEGWKSDGPHPDERQMHADIVMLHYLSNCASILPASFTESRRSYCTATYSLPEGTHYKVKYQSTKNS